MLRVPKICNVCAPACCGNGLICLHAGAPRTEAGHANVVLIIITVICGIAFAGAAAFAVYQHRKYGQSIMTT